MVLMTISYIFTTNQYSLSKTKLGRPLGHTPLNNENTENWLVGGSGSMVARDILKQW